MPESASPALDKKQDLAVPEPKYSTDEIAYLGVLAQRIENSRTQREKKWDELDGMSYSEYWWANEKGANTFIEPKKNKEESNFQSGTVRNKLFAPLAALNNLDLSSDISAYDRNDLEATHFGEVIEDAMEKTSDLEQDEDKRMRRQYELLKQGDVFVEEVWDDVFIKDKRIKGSQSFDGTIKGVTWTTKLKRAYSRPCRNIICGLNVYLGNYRLYDLWRQPFIFTVAIRHRSEIESKYGKWERWDNVPKNFKEFASTTTANSLSKAAFDLTPDIEKDYFQEVKIQDPWNNEFAVILNGVLMTPVGLPLPWGYPQYNIVQQGLEPINENFAIHGSMVKRIKNNVALYDELAKLIVLKAQKSFTPPRFNLSGRVVSRRVFMPGAITSGLNPGDLPKIDDGEFAGPNVSEFNTFKLVGDTIDKSTTNPVFGGQDPGGDPTATQILEVQRQAKVMLGLTVAAASMLEWKLAWLRLYNLLKNWFKPTGDRVESGKLVDTYNTTNVSRPIEGAGMGRRVTIPTKELPTPEDVYALEKQKTQETGIPHRFTFVDPEQITQANLTWQVNITPKEKRTSEVAKMMFGKMIADGLAIGIRFKPDVIGERFATVWGEDPTKIIDTAPAPVAPPGGAPAGPSAISPSIVMPKPKVGAMNAAL